MHRKQIYHLTASSDKKSHHFAEEACLQWVEIIVRLKECVDGVEQRLSCDKHLGNLVHIGCYQVTRNVRIPASVMSQLTKLSHHFNAYVIAKFLLIRKKQQQCE